MNNNNNNNDNNVKNEAAWENDARFQSNDKKAMGILNAMIWRKIYYMYI